MTPGDYAEVLQAVAADLTDIAESLHSMEGVDGHTVAVLELSTITTASDEFSQHVARVLTAIAGALKVGESSDWMACGQSQQRDRGSCQTSCSGNPRGADGPGVECSQFSARGVTSEIDVRTQDRNGGQRWW